MRIYHEPNNREYYSLMDVIQRQTMPIPNSAYHERLREQWGKMTVHIVCVSKVFVGTGQYEVDANGLYQPFARKGSSLIIPGTSIKGVIRTYAEALSPSCEGGRYRGKECGKCISCSIFGALGFQGRVTFCDTHPIDPRGTVDGTYTMSVRWSGRADHGRRFYYHNNPRSPVIYDRNNRPLPSERVEVVNEGTQFTCEVFFENLGQQEMGLLLLAMGLSPKYPFNLKLGGGKNRRLGTVRFESDAIELFSADSYSTFAPTPKAVDDIANWGQQAVDAYLTYLNGLNSQWHQWTLEAIKCFQSDPRP
jgi:CRISPR/Cas system CSM-associated protein Csm3 (group 7 of RAMP superfamily)